MDYEAHQVAALALLALLPHGIYVTMSGRMAPLEGVLTVISLLVIVVFLMLLFGVLEENGHSESPSH